MCCPVVIELVLCCFSGDFENRLPKDILYKMSPFEPVQEFVRQSDYAFYQALVEVLIPDVLRPIPSETCEG